jgi:hypothetical protein
MKALSLTPFWADCVTFEGKSIECRTWQTDYRGDILICASSRRQSGFISGKALCVVELTDIEPFAHEHLEAAGMEPDEMPDKPSYAWHLDKLQWIEPFDVKGRLHLFDVDDELIHLLEPVETLEQYQQFVRDHYLQHVYFARGDDEAREWWSERAGCEVG